MASPRAQLRQLLQGAAGLDPGVVGHLTGVLGLESVSDLANLWTSGDYERGAGEEVAAAIPALVGMSEPAFGDQVARLCAAWRMARGRLAAKAATDALVVGLGWTSPEVSASTFDGLWEALVLSARHPQKFMDVSEVFVADRPGYLVRAMTVNATKKRVEEHIYADERGGHMIYRLVDEETKRETDQERVISVKEGPLRMEVFLRHVGDGFRMHWELPVNSVRQMLQVLVDYAAGTAAKGAVVGLGVCSQEIKGVTHDALWRSMMESIREPARFFPCSDVCIQDCEGFVRRTLNANGETYVEHIYDDEASREIAYRKLLNGAETDVERVVTLRSYPLQLEFHQRNKADGFRVTWDMPAGAPLSAATAFIREAKRMDGVNPTTIGYGISSDPIQDVSYDSLVAAVEVAIKKPWKVLDVDQSTCEVQDCEGYVHRKMRLRRSGEWIIERITMSEERGEAVFNKCDANGKLGDFERVLAIRTPLRLELYERSSHSGLRVDWRAPNDVARDVFTKFVQLASEIESDAADDTIGFGLASKPIDGVAHDALWRAMLHGIRHPAESGLAVDSVEVRSAQGCLWRSMRLLGKPGRPTVTEHIRVLEGAHEVTYRPVVCDQESEEERVFALRRDPLRFEVFCRHARDGIRFDWQAPCSTAIPVFDATAAVARRM